MLSEPKILASYWAGGYRLRLMFTDGNYKVRSELLNGVPARTIIFQDLTSAKKGFHQIILEDLREIK